MDRNKFSDFEIECALLGLMLVEQQAAIKALEYISEKDFYDSKNKAAFIAIKDCAVDGKIDTNILVSIINKDPKLSKILENGKYIHFLLTKSGYLASIDQYLSKLEEKTKLRDLNLIIGDTITKMNQNSSFEEIVSKVQSDILGIESRKKTKYFTEIKVIVEMVKAKLRQRLESETYVGIQSGITDLDKITNGFQDGDLIIVAARPSMGKTAFALNIAVNVAIYKHVAFFSLEMPAEQLVFRIVSMLSNLSSSKIKHATNMDLQDIQNFDLAANRVANLNLFIDDSSSLKLEELIWKARRLKREDRLDLLIIDYLQLIPVTNSGYGENRQQEVSKISRTLKQLARELSIPIIALSQLSRRVELREDKRPMMADLRESGAIEQDADLIAFLYREDYYKKKDLENPIGDIQETSIIISKHRNGAIGVIDLLFNVAKGQFSDKKE